MGLCPLPLHKSNSTGISLTYSRPNTLKTPEHGGWTHGGGFLGFMTPKNVSAKRHMLSSLHPSPVDVHAAGNGSQGLCPESGCPGSFPTLCFWDDHGREICPTAQGPDEGPHRQVESRHPAVLSLWLHLEENLILESECSPASNAQSFGGMGWSTELTEKLQRTKTGAAVGILLRIQNSVISFKS